MLISLILVLLLGGLASYFLLSKVGEQTQPGQSPEDKRAAQERTKEEAIDRAEGSTGPSNESSTGNEEDIVLITKIYSESQSVVIQTALDNNFSWKSCSLQIKTESGSIVSTTEAEAIYQEPKSLCAGFTVPMSDLPKGKLTFILMGVTNDGKHHETQSTFTL